MTTLILQREVRTGQWTDGTLSLGSHVLCVTLEHPERGNRPNDSCIPAGVYKLFIRPNAETRHDYDVIQLIGVPGRTDVQIHIGNRLKDTLGCILVGDKRGVDPGVIDDSRDAYKALLTRVRELIEMTGDVWLDVRDP